MRILIDGDGFPDVREVIEIGKKYNVSVIVYMDSNHEFNDSYASVIFVSPFSNAVDVRIQNDVSSGDVVLTNDYGVAIVVLSRGAKCINSNGLIYTDKNIDILMEQRYLNSKFRKIGRVKGPKKRTIDDKNNLLKVLDELVGE